MELLPCWRGGPAARRPPSSCRRTRPQSGPVRGRHTARASPRAEVEEQRAEGASGRQEGPGVAPGSSGESDAAFLLKLLATSTAGAAAVKYGSLLLDAPFQPSGPLALAMIVLPCVAYSAWLGVLSRT